MVADVNDGTSATDINHNQTVDENHLLYYSAKNNTFQDIRF